MKLSSDFILLVLEDEDSSFWLSSYAFNVCVCGCVCVCVCNVMSS